MKTKIEIVDRLYKAGHITLEEVLVLMENKEVIKWIPRTNPYNQNTWQLPLTPRYDKLYEIYCDTTITQKQDVPLTYTNNLNNDGKQ